MVVDDDALVPGTRLDEFEIERVLGTSEFGITYLAHGAERSWRVTIKEYLPRQWGMRRASGDVCLRSTGHESDYRQGLDQFLNAAHILARSVHPNIVPVHRVLEARCTGYMVAEYVEGRSLAEEFKKTGPWPEARVRMLLDVLTDGLAPIHAAKLLHRDIRPANIMLRADEKPVLIDFSMTRHAMGAFPRSAPDAHDTVFKRNSTQHSQGPWTDIYSLGAVAYEALSGHGLGEAFTGRVEDTLRFLAGMAPRSANPDFRRAIAAALAPRLGDRPKNVETWRVLLGLRDRPAASRYCPSTTNELPAIAGRLSGPVQFIRKLHDTWKLEADQTAALSGFGPSDRDLFNRIINGSERRVGADFEDRVAQLFHIRRTLSALFQDTEVENEWLRESRSFLEGKSPMELLMKGNTKDLQLLRDYVETVAGL